MKHELRRRCVRWLEKHWKRHEPEEHRPHEKCRRPEKPEGCPGPEACECHTHKEMEE